MAQVVYTGPALDHIERAFGFLYDKDPFAALAAARAISSAIAILSEHPFLGRLVDRSLRELVISFGSTGYVALYRHIPERNEVRILAIRHQRELDYPV